MVMVPRTGLAHGRDGTLGEAREAGDGQERLVGAHQLVPGEDEAAQHADADEQAAVSDAVSEPAGRDGDGDSGERGERQAAADLHGAQVSDLGEEEDTAREHDAGYQGVEEGQGCVDPQGAACRQLHGLH
ncbi:hypothetical protein SBI_04854 [Streptomyces bingchenggensis BCW-1]|uniref:Uncharacterized protein n=1 Tax=Streptomyces bingchenggensis (strain BCW-1) TaxID=749414 RepID=D7C173_STRBB|nr:hypothetical protein SBI_04854 [Streptomyces bingchenggensis BCW-1]